MGRHWTEIVVTTDRSRQVIDLTDEVNRQIVPHNLPEGLCLVHVRHATAAITVGETGEGTEKDLLDVLFERVPKLPFRHRPNPGHAPAHLISSIGGRSRRRRCSPGSSFCSLSSSPIPLRISTGSSAPAGPKR